MTGRPAPFMGPTWQAWSMEFYHGVDQAVAGGRDQSTSADMLGGAAGRAAGGGGVALTTSS
jgi:hypothetical protein